MIVISIPVKNHVKKYLVVRYGTEHQVSKKSFLGLFLLQFLEKKIEKPTIDYKKDTKYEIHVPEYFFNTKGYFVDRNKLKFLGICLEKLFMEDFYNFVDNEIRKEGISATQSIKLFFSIYGITENDLKFESIYRNYQRYSGENIKRKKENIVNK